jgi:putative ABC transport system permease protein
MMIGHYVTIALRNFRRSPFTASINVFALALGLAAFVAAYAVTSYWERSERHFANADRTYVITAALAARDGGIRAAGPRTNRLFAEYLRADFPDFEAVARAQVMSPDGGVSAGDVQTRMFIVGVENEFLEIFDLPFVAGDSKTALRSPNSVVLTKAAATRLLGDADPMGKTVTLAGLLDVTVTGVIDEIPEPSHMGHAPSATLRFDVLSSWDTLDGLGAATQARDARRAAERAAANPAEAQPAGQPPGPPAPAAPASAAAPGTAQAAPPAPPQPENWLGNYCCTTYVMLKRDSTLTPRTLNAQLKAFGDRHLPVSQRELASLEVGAVPVSGLMVSLLDSQLLSGAPVSITTLLFSLGALVLAVACVNYANLATAQAARRAHEVGLRKAIGAGRFRVMAQYLAEAALLTLAALAVAVAAVLLAAPALKNAAGIDLLLALRGNTAFWAFLAVLLAGVTLLGGAYPAFVLARVPPVEALRIGRSKIGPRFAGTLLVGVQFAVASFLLIVVIVMYLQNDTLRRTGLGSTADPLLVIQNASQFSGVDPQRLSDELARIPQVKGIGQSGDSPWGPNLNLLMVATTPDENEALVTAYGSVVGYDFFETVGIRILAGRVFDRDHGDDVTTGNMFDSTRPITAVVDDSLVRQLGFTTPAELVDKTIYVPERMTKAFGQAAQPVRVIGVVENKPLHFNGGGASTTVYTMRPNLNFQIVRLSAADVSGGLAAIDSLWSRLSTRPLNRRFMDDIFNENYENFARINQVFGALAALAVVISVIGLFGMAVQVAGRRVHEIGVRKSLGARKSQIVTMLLTSFSKPIVVANLIAWPVGYYVARIYLNVFIQRISLTAVPFMLSLAVALLIACVAVGGQTLRAARVSPATVLRSD